MRSFAKIKPSRNLEITLSFTDIGKSCPSRDFLTLQICLLNAIRENKILAEISEFTVYYINHSLWKMSKISTLFSFCSFTISTLIADSRLTGGHL